MMMLNPILKLSFVLISPSPLRGGIKGGGRSGAAEQCTEVCSETTGPPPGAFRATLPARGRENL